MTMPREQAVELRVLAAAGVGGRTWGELREHVHCVADAEFSAATRHLVTSGALVRDGIGERAIVTRDLTKWVGGPK